MLNEEALYRAAPPWLQTVFMSLHGLRIRRHRYGRRMRLALDSLLEGERWPTERLQEWQNRQLRNVVSTAFEKSRYWRDTMSSIGMTPGDFRGISDLRRLPLLTKETVRDRQADLMTAPPPQPGWLHGHTSGTTGSPLDLWYDRQTAIMNNAVDTRQKRWAGMGDQDWIGLLLGRVVASPAQVRPPFWRANYALRQLWFSSFHLRPENIDGYLAEMRRRGLRFLEGYPSTLFIVAEHLERTGSTLPMSAVFSSSETLHAVQRATIEGAFECKLYDFYGLAERVIFASECGHGLGKHIAEEYGFVEIVDHDGKPVPDGELGFLVGTSLHNLAMPMIRYQTSDISRIRPERCSCGRTSRLLDNVTTKAEDIVLTLDGRFISPSVLTHPFKPFHQILKSQVIQEARDRIIVKIVPSADFTPAHQAGLIAGLAERLGGGVHITVELVDDIPRERSGKYRWVISKVHHDCKINWDAD
ncbi:MAG: phenylacetate--CoA ligase family protein [Gemmatimonadales bacterium]